MSIELKAVLQVGKLALIAPLDDGRWRALCLCGTEVFRDPAALRIAVKKRFVAACQECKEMRNREIRRKREGKPPRDLMKGLTAEQTARVLKLTRGRKSEEVVRDAVDMVRKNQDLIAEGTRPREDAFKCDFKHRYQGMA